MPASSRDPDRFLPERWTPELGVASQARLLSLRRRAPHLHRRVVCVDGAGAGLGDDRAAWELRLVPGHPIVPQPLLTLRAKHGMKMTVRRRVLESVR